MMAANKELKDLICDTIGDKWTQPGQMEALKELEKYASNSDFQKQLLGVKYHNKERLAKYIKEHQDITVNPHSIFDIQVKRIHEYKRQLLNALHIMHVYNQLRSNPNADFVPKTYIFAGKAAPSYYFAKQVIKLINVIADKINHDPLTKDKLSVVFIPNFNVSSAELIYPAAEISEQISTAGKEASGTGNMKFMMNGAITLGTMDGANIEIAEHVGMDNIYTFGLSAEEVANYNHNGGYHSVDVLQQNPNLQKVMNQLIDGSLGGDTFHTIYDALVLNNDTYFVLKDFASYCDIQDQSSRDYLNHHSWQKKSIINIANSGIFSSDRSIADYRRDIWKIK